MIFYLSGEKKEDEGKEEPKENAFLSVLKDWKYAIPIGMMVGIPTIANEVSDRLILHILLLRP